MKKHNKTTEQYLKRADLSRKYGVTIQSIINWEHQGLPVVHRDPGPKGTVYYDEQVADEWYIENVASDSDESIQEAELRLKRAQASIQETKLLKLRAELIATKRALHYVSLEYQHVRGKLLSLPTRCAPHVYVPSLSERIAIMEVAVRDVLTELTFDTLTEEEVQELLSDDEELNIE